MAGFATVRQTLFVAAWSLGVTIAAVSYYPDPQRRDVVLSILLVLLFGAAAVLDVPAAGPAQREDGKAALHGDRDAARDPGPAAAAHPRGRGRRRVRTGRRGQARRRRRVRRRGQPVRHPGAHRRRAGKRSARDRRGLQHHRRLPRGGVPRAGDHGRGRGTGVGPRAAQRVRGAGRALRAFRDRARAAHRTRSANPRRSP